jgi:hypothetical protein
MLRLWGYNSKKVLIVGAGPVGQMVAQTLLERPWAGFSIIGFLDDRSELQEQTILSLPVLGDLEKAHSIVKTMQVDDEVIIAMPTTEHLQMALLINKIEDVPVNVRVVPDLFGVAYIRPNIEDLWGIPLIGIRTSGVTTWISIVKRLIDVVGALLGLVLLSPVMLIIAIWIKFDSGGPVLFVQQRAGENGKLFNIFKFGAWYKIQKKNLPN